jgi:hypothetical protein
MADRRHRPSRHLQRRIRAHQLNTGKPYMVAALAVTTERVLGWRYLPDHAVPVDVAAAVRDGGFISLEPLRQGQAGRSPFHLHDACGAKNVIRLHNRSPLTNAPVWADQTPRGSTGSCGDLAEAVEHVALIRENTRRGSLHR